MRNRYLLGAGVALAVAMSWANAQAQLFAAPAGPGAWYFGGEGGWTSLDGQDGNILGLRVKQGSGSGFNVGARAGYEWGPWRFEEEFRFQQNGQDSFSIGGLGLPVTGNRNAYAIMSNVIYDFNVGWLATPHIGAGIGAVGLRSGLSLRSPVGPVPAGLSLVDNTTWEFGYQAIAGVRYNINPALAFDLDYRYLGTTDPTFRTRFGGISYTTGYSSHSLLASLSVRFGAPPPAVAPPAPPAPPMVARKVFLVFFDWDRDTITPEGMQIVQQAAAAFRAGAPVTIQVTGYADRSGSPGYNQRLSERRAHHVSDALVRFGVPRQAQVVGGRGENDNRVPTADGVREPQNRRVEIVFP